MWQDITFRTGHPNPHVTLWWIAGDWQSCPSHSATFVNTDTSRSSSRVFLFLRQWSITSENSAGIKKPSGGQFTPIYFGTSLQRGPALSVRAFFYRVSVFTKFLYKSFTEISRSQGSRRISVTSQPWHADGCVSPTSRIGRELPSIGPYKDWLTTWTLEAYPQNCCWNSLRQLYSCLSKCQLLVTMARPWIAPSPTTSYCINGTKSYEESLPLCH